VTSLTYRHLRTALLAVLFSLLGLGLAQSVLRIAVTTGPPTVDPHFSPTRATADIAINVFEQLVGYGEDFSIRPLLAESWEISDDGLTYTFELFEGVLFHNGRTVTADDVVASLERVLEISPARSRLAAIESVEALDEHTVRLNLSEPSGPLLQHLAGTNASILPAEAIDGREGGEAEIIGTGPFRFVEWLPDRHVRLASFDDYVERPGDPSGNTGTKRALVDEVLIIPVPEDASRANGLQAGEYHIADFLPYGAGRRLQNEAGVVILEVNQHMMPFAYFNHREDRISADPDIRRAVQAALNHEDMLAIAAEGHGRLNPSYYFGVWETDRGTEPYDQRDPERARQLLQQAGYDGEPFVIVTNTGFDVMYRSALVIERQLQQIGINTELQVYDWPGSLAVRSEGEWDLFMSGHLLQQDPSIIEFHLQPETSPFNHADPVVSDLFERANRASGVDERRDIFAELQAHTYGTVPWIKLFDQNVFQGTLPNVEGYRPWPFMRAFNVSID
jgi:peptide/nickel transport system substrate-binding protein